MEQQTKKNLIIRLIIYPIVIIAAFFLCRFSWRLYAQEHPEQALKMHILGLKLRGIEYCETPEEVIQRYAEALIKGDREEALEYVYKLKYDFHGWGEKHKRRLYNESDEEIMAKGDGMKNGFFTEKWQEGYGGRAEWHYKYTLQNQTYDAIIILSYTFDGWKVDY